MNKKGDGFKVFLTWFIFCVKSGDIHVCHIRKIYASSYIKRTDGTYFENFLSERDR